MNLKKNTLKTEIVMKRDPKIRNKYKQFAISSYESKDYINCINYFREAQQQELNGNNKQSNRFYELCLSLRYLYPLKLAINLFPLQNENNTNNQNNKNNKNSKNTKNNRNNTQYQHEKQQQQKLLEIPFDIWNVVFYYTPAREIEILSLLFPIEITLTSSPYFSPNKAIAPSLIALSGDISLVVTLLFCLMK